MKPWGRALVVTLYSLMMGLALAAPAPSKQPLTDAECEAVGRDLEAQWEKGDHKALTRLMDVDALVNNALRGVEVSDSVLSQLRGGFAKGFVGSMDQGLAQSDSYHFLRLRKYGRDPKVLMRLITTGGGVNYHELVLFRAPDGKVRISDMFVYATGETMSETIRRLLVPLLAESQKSLVEKLFADKADLVKSASDWSKMTSLASSGKMAEAMKVYETLPPSVQKEKFVLLIRLKATQHLDEKEYLATIDLWRKTYPKDASIDLISLDAYAARKQFTEAFAALDRMDKALEGDPFMHVQRGLFYLIGEDKVRAKTEFLKAIDEEPSLRQAYEFGVGMLAQDRQYAAAIKLLSQYETTSHHSHEDVIKLVEKSQLLRPLSFTAEYKQWRGGAAPATVGIPGNSKGAVTPTTGKAEPPKPAATALKLNGIFYKASGASATINGKFVTVGDRILEHKVVAIEKDSVTLEAADGKKVTLKVD